MPIMGGNVIQAEETSSIPTRAKKPKSKTGCKTCKIRRVRCGEERPACRRCLTTGRVCDGYGIWGGGGNEYGQRRRSRQPESSQLHTENTKHLLVSTQTLHASPIGTLDADERYHFEWFWRRTARKMPGAFYSANENALFFQACASDSAVTHAVLAICSAHGVSHNANNLGSSAVLRSEEDFALRQYNKAIGHLQRHLHSDDAVSVRIALFSCLAFIFVELFRSHYQTAARHFEHGLEILEYAQSIVGPNGFAGRPIDGWALGVFKRLYVQSTMFGQRPRRARPFGHNLAPLSKVTIFLNAHEARDYLENILMVICELIETQSGHSEVNPAEAGGHNDLIESIKTELDFWLLAYDNTLAMLEYQMDKVEAFACRVLRMYYTVAVIMADTAGETRESKYDRHTASFLSLIQQMLSMRTIALNNKIREKYFGSSEGLSHSIGDIGPVAPLYFLAVKCRVRRLRIHAVRMLEEEPRKEGIYDAVLAANIARQVMAVERIGSHEIAATSDEFDLSESPMAEDLLQDPYPQEAERVQILDVRLPNGPWEPTILRCRYQNAVVTYPIDHRLCTDT
jgi:hypothetical protein